MSQLSREWLLNRPPTARRNPRRDRLGSSWDEEPPAAIASEEHLGQAFGRLGPDAYLPIPEAIENVVHLAA